MRDSHRTQTAVLRMQRDCNLLLSLQSLQQMPQRLDALRAAAQEPLTHPLIAAAVAARGEF